MFSNSLLTVENDITILSFEKKEILSSADILDANKSYNKSNSGPKMEP